MRPEPRAVSRGESFTIGEDTGGLIARREVPPHPDPPPEHTRGEPWGWTKGPPYPRGWREDGRYDTD
jgi:hypothetical protein